MKNRLFLIILILLLSGCHNYNELEDMAICTAMAVDLEDDKYKITYMVANSKKSNVSAKEGEAQTILYEGVGDTIDKAINEIMLISPKVIYIGHLSVVVISDEVAKKGVFNILDYLLRAPSSRKDFDIVLTNESKASDTLKILSPLENFPSRNILSNLQSSLQLQSFSQITNYNKFIEILLDDGINPYLSSIKVMGDIEEGSKLEALEQTVPSAYLKIGTIGLFKDDKLVAFSSDEEDLGINIISNKLSQTLLIVPCDDKIINYSIDKSDTKINIENNNVTIKINTESSMEEILCKVDLTDEKVINKLENEAAQKMKKLVIDAFNLAQKNKTDIFGIGNMIYKNNYKRWKEIKENWDDEFFPKLNINIDNKFKIISTSSLKQSLGESQ